jgi:hypothetical protein
MLGSSPSKSVSGIKVVTLAGRDDTIGSNNRVIQDGPQGPIRDLMSALGTELGFHLSALSN